MVDVGRIEREFSEAFIARDPKDPKIGIWCDPKINKLIPDKRTMTKVVKKLSDYTDLVQAAVDEGVGGLAGVWLDVFGGGSSPGQWTLDMGRWRERLAGYQFVLDKAKNETGPASCEELRETVALPLIMGFYQAGTPGITAPPDVKSVADNATPYILGNGITVYHEFARENYERFKDDIVKEIKKLAKAGLGLAAKVAIAAGVAGGAVLAWKYAEGAEKKR